MYSRNGSGENRTEARLFQSTKHKIIPVYNYTNPCVSVAHVDL